MPGHDVETGSPRETPSPDILAKKAVRYVNLRGELRDPDIMTVHEIILGDKFGLCSYIPDTSPHSPVLHQLCTATVRTLKTQ